VFYGVFLRIECGLVYDGAGLAGVGSHDAFSAHAVPASRENGILRPWYHSLHALASTRPCMLSIRFVLYSTLILISQSTLQRSRAQRGAAPYGLATYAESVTCGSMASG